jgi:hypothetical protein
MEGDFQSDQYFVVQISTHDSGERFVKIDFDATEFGISPKASGKMPPEEDADKRGAKDESEHFKPRSDLTVAEKFERLSDEWVATGISFFEFVPEISANSLRFAADSSRAEVADFAGELAVKRAEYVDSETKVEEYLLTRDDLPLILKKLGKSIHTFRAADTMRRSTLGALVSEYEVFLIKLLHLISEVRPEVFVSESDQISFGDLSKFQSLAEAREAFLNDKIESLLQEKSHFEMLTWLEGKFSVNLTSNKTLIAEFVEVCQRRHLLMHAGGVVNRRYQRVCEKAGVKPESLGEVGSKLAVNRKYLRQATSRVFQIGFFSLHILWQKLILSDVEKSCNCLVSASHDFLEDGLTKMARRVCDFALLSKTPKSEKAKTYLIVNKALSYLLDYSIEESERKASIEKVLLEKGDWSVTSPTIDLALACLRKDYSRLDDLVEAAKKDGIKYYQANTWMIFHELRKDTNFLTKFGRKELLVKD